MGKYNIGDRFEMDLTDIKDSGMGTVYEFNYEFQISEKNMDKLIPLSEEEQDCETITAHTLEDLKNRIMYLSKTLSAAIDTYWQSTEQIENTIAAIDSIPEE